MHTYIHACACVCSTFNFTPLSLCLIFNPLSLFSHICGVNIQLSCSI